MKKILAGLSLTLLSSTAFSAHCGLNADESLTGITLNEVLEVGPHKCTIKDSEIMQAVYILEDGSLSAETSNFNSKISASKATGLELYNSFVNGPIRVLDNKSGNVILSETDLASGFKFNNGSGGMLVFENIKHTKAANINISNSDFSQQLYISTSKDNNLTRKIRIYNVSASSLIAVSGAQTTGDVKIKKSSVDSNIIVVSESDVGGSIRLVDNVTPMVNTSVVASENVVGGLVTVSRNESFAMIVSNNELKNGRIIRVNKNLADFVSITENGLGLNIPDHMRVKYNNALNLIIDGNSIQNNLRLKSNVVSAAYEIVNNEVGKNITCRLEVNKPTDLSGNTGLVDPNCEMLP